MSKKIYAKTIVRKDVSRETSPADKPNRKSKILPSLSDRLAGDQFYYLHHYWPGCRAFERDNPRLRIVKKFYPYAEGGELYVDEPVFPFQKLECERKAPIMRAAGLRYVVIEPDTTYDEALAQLGATCGQPQSPTYAP